MKRGKYEAPRKTNPLGIFFWIIFIVFLVLGSILLFRSCSQAEDPQNTTPKVPVSDTLAPPSTATNPSEEPTEPETTPPTEPVTEPSTEPETTPSTEPITEPTEPVTEPTTPTTEPDTGDAPDDTLGLAIVAVARSALGKAYAPGGNGPDSFDTSGFVSYCFRENGISVPRGTSALFAAGEAVEKEDLQPGDVVFFYQGTPGKAEYPGIYTGDGTFIAVSSSQEKVLERSMTSSYYTEHYVAARRYATTP